MVKLCRSIGMKTSEVCFHLLASDIHGLSHWWIISFSMTLQKLHIYLIMQIYTASYTHHRTYLSILQNFFIETFMHTSRENCTSSISTMNYAEYTSNGTNSFPTHITLTVNWTVVHHLARISMTNFADFLYQL